MFLNGAVSCRVCLQSPAIDGDNEVGGEEMMTDLCVIGSTWLPLARVLIKLMEGLFLPVPIQ